MSDNPWENTDFGRPNKPSNSSGEKKATKPSSPKSSGDDYDFLNGIKDNFKKNFNLGNDNKISGKNIFLIIFSGILLYFSTGIFTIAPEQQAIITRFGKYNRTLNPGLHYRFPYPIEQNFKETVTRVRTHKIGIESAALDVGTRDVTSKSLYLASSNDGKGMRLQEGLMLTGDENIIDMHFEVQWKIKNLRDYVFSVKDPIKNISDVSQSVIREIVAKNTLADIITKGRAIIESTTAEKVQYILDEYKSGVEVIAVQMLRADPPLPVIDAFRDVQTARVDKESEINRAESYASDITPKARGEAQKILQSAEAFSIETVSRAQGQVSRFNSIYEQYKNAKYVTRKRMYIETLEDIFGEMDKIIIDDNVSKGVVPYLPLDMLNKKAKEDNSEI